MTFINNISEHRNTRYDERRYTEVKRYGRTERKERVTRDNKYDVSCEMVAQSNSCKGKSYLY